MKKAKLILLLSLVVLSVPVLAGCQKSSRETELENKVDQLEQEITSLEKQANSNSANTAGSVSDNSGAVNNTDTAANNASGSTNGTNTSSANTTAQNSSFDVTTATIESLTKAVDDATAAADAATASGNITDDRNQFFTLKAGLDAVDDQLDIYDDYIEMQQRQGAITFDDYRSREIEIEKLEDRLDLSEKKIGMDFWD